MIRIKRFLVLGLFIALTAVVVAPVFAERPQFYLQTVFIERIHTHSLGYRVDYNRSNFRLGQVYIPYSWFTPAGQAEIVYANSRSVPYMNVVYRDGEFSHVRLYVHRDQGHPSWVSLRDSEEVRQRFDTDTFNIRY
ncbi:MAG: hypothetical protein EA404_15680 [Spirochaetaceae bacterium]|nr:MAG: hypothetical protein EA404_15680 [Spirochaetaceae bacterium]